MASGKHKRKASRQACKQKLPAIVPLRHRDGDRRRRGGMTYEQVMELKKKLHEAESSAITSQVDPGRL
jgi:hypothetical protein